METLKPFAQISLSFLKIAGQRYFHIKPPIKKPN